MAALKLYFAIINVDSTIQVSVHRELSTLKIAWQEASQADSVGIIHVGFVRPKISKPSDYFRYRGGVLVSVAAKWALPSEYKCSVSVVAEFNSSGRLIPAHLLLKGLGFEKPESNASFRSTGVSEGSHSSSIAGAALAVLKESCRPLNKEEIFARIIEQDLYCFEGRKPVSILAVELNRYSIGAQYSTAAIEPLFNKLEGDLFCALSGGFSNLTGWVRQLSIDSPHLSDIAISYGIVNEESYVKYVTSLPSKHRNQLEIYRYKALLDKTDVSDPVTLMKILPGSMTEANINSLGFPVRITNVFNTNSICCLDDLTGISVEDMLKWPNFGRKSVKDLCISLLDRVDKMVSDVDLVYSTTKENNIDEISDYKDSADESYQLEVVSLTPLKVHFEKTLFELSDNQRQIIECRTGYAGEAMTLEGVGDLIGVTRERIRQIQKKYVAKIIETEYWDDCIALKIGQLLIDREEPLYIEMLELEDPWFEGYMGNYQHLAAIIELFSENEIRIIKVSGASVVTRIKPDAWDECVTHFRKSLKDKAEVGGWSRYDIEMTIKSSLSENGAAELLPLMWNQFDELLQFDGEQADSILIGFGKSAEAAVAAVLTKAESPLHYSEIAIRASEVYGREVHERLAQNALPRLGAKLYGRGIYGLAHHNPLTDRMCKNIRLVVTNMIQNGPMMKQWHCAEIIKQLKAQFPVLPESLDHYILNIILGDAEHLEYLNRMVWARSDSGQSKGDRVDMADAFTKILQDHGGPLKGRELKERLKDVRGVVDNLQIHPTGRMIQLGPDYWGLADRDVGGNKEDNISKLNTIYSYLVEQQKGIHVSEVCGVVKVSDDNISSISAYALLNLAQRDDRFYLGRSMYLGLSDWGGETRRLNISQAVRVVLSEMSRPMKISELNARVEDLIGMPMDANVTNLLIDEGAIYNPGLQLWSKP